MSEFIDKFAGELKRSGYGWWWTIRGCTESEIRLIEEHLNLRLPKVYREFLKKMGRQAGKLFVGTDMFYNDLFDNREGFQELLEEDEFSFDLKPSIFVFAGHQGYTYLFFDTEESLIDPPVYSYNEGELQIKRLYDSFSDFLSESLENLKKIYE